MTRAQTTAMATTTLPLAALRAWAAAIRDLAEMAG